MRTRRLGGGRLKLGGGRLKLGRGGQWVFAFCNVGEDMLAASASPMALTLPTRSVSEGDDKRRFPSSPSLPLRVTGDKVSAIERQPTVV